MAGLWDFLTADLETRQQRRRDLNESMNSGLDYILGPTGIPDKLRGVNDLVNPVLQIEQAGVDTSTAFDSDRSYDERRDAAIRAMVGTAAAAAPAIGMHLGGRGATAAVTETLANISPRQTMSGIDDAARAFARSEAGELRLPNARSTTAVSPRVLNMPDGTTRPWPKTMADVPDLRGMNTEDALFIARQEPHLIPAGKGTEGFTVGGPRTFTGVDNIEAQRASMDAQVARGAEAGDWYDRYGADINEVTGGNARDNTWMANREGQFSAGVDPQTELQLSLRDMNSAIATGDPVQARFPAQRDATRRAIDTNDAANFQLGNKTGQYADQINPNNAGLADTAVGVNDYRHARTLGFTEADGSPQAGALSSQQHLYADYETALATGRARDVGLAGRTDWQGRQIQAAPWVVQKSDDIFAQRRPSLIEAGRAKLRAAGITDPTPEQLEKAGWDEAYEYSNRTIGGFFDKHTANATYEVQPYVDSGHLPALQTDPAAAAAYAVDPRAAWNTADGGRDAIYSGMRLGETGDAVRTRPTVTAQGAYTPPNGVTEFNRAEVARPLVSFDNAGGAKIVPSEDAALLDAAEATRSYIDVQGAGAWNKDWTGARWDLHRPCPLVWQRTDRSRRRRWSRRWRSVAGTACLTSSTTIGASS